MYWIGMIKILGSLTDPDGRLNILLLECSTREEALTVLDNASRRRDMYSPQLYTSRPVLDPEVYRVEVRDRSNYTRWYQEGMWKYMSPKRSPLFQEFIDKIDVHIPDNTHSV